MSGCDPNDRVYFRSGIGTDLYTADIGSATELQNVYLDYLCRQAGSYVGADSPGCSQQFVPANIWPVIVQAGLNDIDTRCDSYLAWLDQKKRENSGILAEIGAVRIAADALTNPNIAGVSGVGLAAISAAFGLATNTVTNFNSLLLQVDQTTVQNVVFTNRHLFREDLLKFSSSIDNKPAAIHTLRTYLTICMPMTIAAKINSTVTVFQQTGTGVGAGPIIPTIGVQFTPASKVEKPARGSFVPPDPVVAAFFAETNLSKAETEFTLSGLCIEKNAKSGLTKQDLVKRLVAIYEATPDGSDSKPTVDGVISAKERRAINKQTDCGAAMNYFEKFTYANTVVQPDNTAFNLQDFIKLLKRSPAAVGLDENTPLGSMVLRDKIAAVRAYVGQNDAPLATEATFALITAIKKKYPK